MVAVWCGYRRLILLEIERYSKVEVCPDVGSCTLVRGVAKRLHLPVYEI